MDREGQMRDAVALDACRRVAEGDRLDAHGPEGGPSVAHGDRDEVDGDLVQQVELQALSGDRSGGDRDAAP